MNLIYLFYSMETKKNSKLSIGKTVLNQLRLSLGKFTLGLPDGTIYDHHLKWMQINYSPHRGFSGKLKFKCVCLTIYFIYIKYIIELNE